MQTGSLHTFFVYVFFGYFFLYPVVFLLLRLFRINDPGQRLVLYLMTLFTPFAGYALYHTVLAKRCQSGIYPDGLFWQVFDLFCRIGAGAIRFLGPVLALLAVFGLLKALAGVLYLARLRAKAIAPDPVLAERTAAIIRQRCHAWNMPEPAVIFTARDSFAAFAAGLVRPVVVISSPLAAQLTHSELAGILTHELVHIRRGDTITGWFCFLARDLMFFSPFSTLLLDRILLERERICDRETVDITGKPQQYAGTLVKVWRLLLERREYGNSFATGFTGRKQDLEQRVQSLLVNNEESYHALPGGLFLALVCSLATVTVLYLGIIC